MTIKLKLSFLFLAIACFMNPLKSSAQEQALDDQEIINVENLYKATPPPAAQPVKIPVSETPGKSPIVESEILDPSINAQAEKNLKTPQKVDRITDLNKLSPFREVSIIQKKYLPKTERFQLFGGLGATTNSPWFLNLGVKLNLGYYFTESFGVEASGVFLSNSERQVAQEIRTNNNLQPEKFVNTKSYIGLDLVWAPIYGKITMLNERIIPFDMYFSAGVGNSSTNSQEGSNPTLHLGTGQIFAISKAIAFRWDYSWTLFQATPVADSNLGSAQLQKNSYNDLILTAGFSFFFPEAKYR